MLTFHDPEGRGKAALAGAARAFDRAKRHGYVRVGDQGTFETCEGWLNPPEQKTKNPDQLRLI